MGARSDGTRKVTRGGRPRWVITPEALAAFERARTGGPATQQVPRRRRRLQAVDYFAD